jgi:hypothetical protein
VNHHNRTNIVNPKLTYAVRKNDWVNFALSLKIIDNSLIAFVQGLGRLDESLGRSEDEIKTYFINNPNVQDAPLVKEWASMRMKRNDAVILAQLWVLGCYEATRTIDQFLNSQKPILYLKSAESFKKTKHFHERIRVPLAKLEPAKRWKETDYKIAIPGFSESASMIWKISKDESIARDDLANSFIGSLAILFEETKK